MGLLRQGKLENTLLVQFALRPQTMPRSNKKGGHISGDYLWETRDLKTIPKSKWSWGSTFNNMALASHELGQESETIKFTFAKKRFFFSIILS